MNKMPAHKHNLQKITVYTLLGFIIFVGILSIWLYTGSVTGAKTRAFQILPLPIALVNGSPLFMNSLSQRYTLGQKISGVNGPQKSAILDQMALEEQLRQVAEANGVFVSQKQIDSEYQDRASQADLQGKNSFEDLLNTYGLSAAAYKNQVITPELMQINLQTWFNGQKALNTAVYSQAENLLQRIQAGEDMSVLAASFSQDQNTKSVGGDMGFMDPANSLPELREPLSEMQAGEARILPSRFGLHIVRLEEKNGNSLHLRQIFLGTGSFDKWYAQQAQKYKIKKLITI